MRKIEERVIVFGAPVRLHVIMGILGRVDGNKDRGQEWKGRKGERDRDGQKERQMDIERNQNLYFFLKSM